MKFARTRQGDAWVYDDPAIHEAITMILLTHRLDVSQIDDWIESDNPPWHKDDEHGDSREEALVNRHRLVAAEIAGNHEAVSAWVAYLKLLFYASDTRRKLHPLARDGYWLNQKLPPGEKRDLYRPKVSPFEKKARAARAKRLRAEGMTFEQIAASMGVSQPTVRAYLR
jgi:hypothetical protein